MGKTAEDVQPFLNIAKHFQRMSEMSYGDLKTVGYSLGVSEPDNGKSKGYTRSTSAAVTTKSSNGMTNNCPLQPQSTYIGAGKDNTTCTTAQFDKCNNTGIRHRLCRDVDTAAESTNGLFGATSVTIASKSQL